MKTAISIPDEVFEAAERAARKLGVSRSELYATAVQEFVERHRVEDVTARLDDVYSYTPRRSANLGRESVVNVSQIITFDKAFLSERVDRLQPAKLREVEEGIRLVLAL